MDLSHAKPLGPHQRLAALAAHAGYSPPDIYLFGWAKLPKGAAAALVPAHAVLALVYVQAVVTDAKPAMVALEPLPILG